MKTVSELSSILRERHLELRLDFFGGMWTAIILHQGMVQSRASEFSMEEAILKALGALS